MTTAELTEQDATSYMDRARAILSKVRTIAGAGHAAREWRRLAKEHPSPAMRSVLLHLAKCADQHQRQLIGAMKERRASHRGVARRPVPRARGR